MTDLVVRTYIVSGICYTAGNVGFDRSIRNTIFHSADKRVAVVADTEYRQMTLVIIYDGGTCQSDIPTVHIRVIQDLLDLVVVEIDQGSGTVRYEQISFILRRTTTEIRQDLQTGHRVILRKTKLVHRNLDQKRIAIQNVLYGNIEGRLISAVYRQTVFFSLFSVVILSEAELFEHVLQFLKAVLRLTITENIKFLICQLRVLS